MVSKSKPIISANMVTSIRLLAMPYLAWLIYQGPLSGGDTSAWWWALVLGSVIGCTDFVDGFLARKYGPTVLGGMMDPLADKVFIALIYLPMIDVDIQYFPGWAVGLLFVREFLVTSIRSAYEWRGLQLKTSFFGKVKTWVQMQGILILILAAIIPPETLRLLLLLSAGLPLVAALYYWFAKREFSLAFTLGVVFTLGTVVLFEVPESQRTSVNIALYLICALTWMSGLDYLLGAIPALKKSGGFHRADIVRVLSAVTVPVSAVVALTTAGVPSLPVLAIIASELAVGGLDNLLSRHKAMASPLSFGIRALGSSVLLLGAVFIAAPLAWVAMLVSIAGTTHEFWQGRVHYLDDSKWDEELVH